MTQDNRIRALLDSLVSEREALAKKSEPLKIKRSAVQAKVAPLDAEIRDLTKQIREIESDKLVKLDKSIGQLHKALGANALSAGEVTEEA